MNLILALSAIAMMALSAFARQSIVNSQFYDVTLPIPDISLPELTADACQVGFYFITHPSYVDVMDIWAEDVFFVNVRGIALMIGVTGQGLEVKRSFPVREGDDLLYFERQAHLTPC